MNDSTRKNLIRRLRIAEGQVRGLQRLVANDTYCIDIITQSLAAKKALSGVEDILLENHLKTHVIEQIQKGKDKNKPAKEIVRVYRLSKHK